MKQKEVKADLVQLENKLISKNTKELIEIVKFVYLLENLGDIDSICKIEENKTFIRIFLKNSNEVLSESIVYKKNRYINPNDIQLLNKNIIISLIKYLIFYNINK